MFGLFRYSLLILIIKGLNPSAGIKPPEIKVIAWVEGENGAWRDDVGIGNQDEVPVVLSNQNTYILTNEVLLILFLCVAPYPTQWDFSHAKWIATHKKSLGGLIMSSRRLSVDINNPKTFTYWSEIGLYGDSNLFNGNYVCSKADDASVKSNISVFWEGGPFDNVFVLSGSNLSVWADRSDKIIFPCYVRDPEAQVVLLQDNPLFSVNNTVNDAWTDVTSIQNLVFKPEIGFVFQKSPSGEWMEPGMYKCATKDGSDSLLLNFFPKYEDQSPLVMNGPIREPASLKTIRDRYGRDAFECCSKSDKPPRISVWNCENPSMCKMFQTSMRNEIKRDLSVFLGVIKTNGSCATYFRGWGGALADLAVVHCIGDGIEVFKEFFTRSPQKVSYTDWDSKSLQNWVEIAPKGFKIANDTGKQVLEVYSGEAKRFNCRAASYFFSYGIRWTVKNKDGTIEILPDIFETIKQTPILVLLPTKTIDQSVTINVTNAMESVTCNAPVWNSSEWITQTVEFSVKESIPPAIDNAETETVFWSLNETDRTLICKSTGDPEPKVIWTKDNNPRSILLYNVSNHQDGIYHVYKLIISHVTHDVQGDFKCTVINFAGRTEKNWSVFVEDSKLTEITTAIIATIVILILLLGGIVLVKKTILQKKSLDNLRESVYRPESSSSTTTATDIITS